MSTWPELQAEAAERLAGRKADRAETAGHADVTAGLLCLADVAPEAVTWLWAGRLPSGKLVMLDGPPGAGKTTLAIAIASALSRGDALPGDAPREPVSTLLVSAEDGAADTLAPRAIAAGAAMRRLHVLTEPLSVGLSEQGLLGLAELSRALDATGARLLVLDPLAAILDVRDAHRDAEVRRALAPLQALCAERGVAILAIRHLRKSPTGDGITAGGGSIAYSAAARSVLVAATDPRDDTTQALTVAKCNLAPRAPGLRYRLASSPDGVPVVQWAGETATTADDLVSPRESAEERSEQSDGERYLRELLESKPAVLATDVITGSPVPERTLKRARARLPINVRRRDPGNPRSPWVWEWRTGTVASWHSGENSEETASTTPEGQGATTPREEEDARWT